MASADGWRTAAEERRGEAEGSAAQRSSGGGGGGWTSAQRSAERPRVVSDRQTEAPPHHTTRHDTTLHDSDAEMHSVTRITASQQLRDGADRRLLRCQTQATSTTPSGAQNDKKKVPTENRSNSIDKHVKHGK